MITNGRLQADQPEPCVRCLGRQAAGENIACNSECGSVTGDDVHIAGDWHTHGVELSWVSEGGKNNVLFMEDRGMLSDLWQSFPTTPGKGYLVEYNVLVYEVFDCKIPRSGCWGNGALDIHDGEHCDIGDYQTWDSQVANGNDGVTRAGSENTCFSEQSDILYLNPMFARRWLTLTGSFIARSSLAVVRIHTDSAASAWLSRVSVTEAPSVTTNPYLNAEMAWF